jgi:SAM-dependent methyltransferase
MAAHTHVPGYVPFPSLPHKNLLQAGFEVPTLARALRLPRGGRVLEVGCGRGVALGPLAELLEPERLVGVDVDEIALREAARGPAETLRADVRALPFDAASFDLVVDFGTCYHVAEPERALREVARVLAPGGLFVHETEISQLLAHPIRSFGRALPWAAAPELAPERSALLWGSRRRA